MRRKTLLRILALLLTVCMMTGCGAAAEATKAPEPTVAAAEPAQQEKSDPAPEAAEVGGYTAQQIYTQAADGFDAWALQDEYLNTVYLIKGSDAALVVDGSAAERSADLFAAAKELSGLDSIGLAVTSPSAAKTSAIEDFVLGGGTVYVNENSYLETAALAYGSEAFRHASFEWVRDGEEIDLGDVALTVYQFPVQDDGAYVLVMEDKGIAFVSDLFYPALLADADSTGDLSILSAAQIFLCRVDDKGCTAWTRAGKQVDLAEAAAAFVDAAQEEVNSNPNADSVAYLSNIEVFVDGEEYPHEDHAVATAYNARWSIDQNTFLGTHVNLNADVSEVTLKLTPAVEGSVAEISSETKPLPQTGLFPAAPMEEGICNGTSVVNSDGTVTVTLDQEEFCGALVIVNVTSADGSKVQPFAVILRRENDADDPVKPLYTGRFDKDLGENGAITLYIPENNEQLSGNNGYITVLGPDGMSLDELYEDSAWVKVADETGSGLIFIPAPEEGWNLEDPEADLARLAAIVLATSPNNQWQMGTRYLAGYGSGAVIAQLAAAGTTTYNGVVAIAPSQDLTGVNDAATLATPAWVIPAEDVSCDNAVAFWKSVNSITDADEAVEEDGVQKFTRSDPGTVWLTEGDLDAYRVWVGGSVTDLGSEEELAAVNAFLRHAFRTSITNDYTVLVDAVPQDAPGLERHYEEVGGFKRLWFSYVPESIQEELKSDPDAKFPVVLMFHGYTSTAMKSLACAGWLDSAEANKFILLAPQAYAYGTTTTVVQGTTMPTWNHTDDNSAPDDVAFADYLYDYALENYPADASRLYVTGFSMGSWMTHIVASSLSEKVAAAAPRSGVFNFNFAVVTNIIYPKVRENVEIPVWMMVGDSEMSLAFFSPPTLDNTTGKHINIWLEREGFEPVEDFTALNWVQDEKDPDWSTISFCNDDGVELIRYSHIENHPHTETRVETQKVIDWMFQYSREPDGTLFFEAAA